MRFLIFTPGWIPILDHIAALAVLSNYAFQVALAGQVEKALALTLHMIQAGWDVTTVCPLSGLPDLVSYTL